MSVLLNGVKKLTFYFLFFVQFEDVDGSTFIFHWIHYVS